MKDEELYEMAGDLRAREGTINELAARLSETAEAAEKAAQAAQAIDKERKALKALLGDAQGRVREVEAKGGGGGEETREGQWTRRIVHSLSQGEAVEAWGGGGGGFEEGGEGSVGGGRSVRKDLGGGLWGVKEARSAVIPRSQRKPPPSRSRSRGEGSRGEGRQVEVEREREDLSRSVQGGRGRRLHVRSKGAGPDVGESFWTGGSGEKHQLGVEGEN